MVGILCSKGEKGLVQGKKEVMYMYYETREGFILVFLTSKGLILQPSKCSCKIVFLCVTFLHYQKSK